MMIIPKWQAHAVLNWGGLLIQLDDGEWQVNPVTATLINYMPVVGLTKLCKENLDDAWRRIAMHQDVFGSILVDSSSRRPLFLTRPDVARHVGIETEGESYTFDEFCAKVMQSRLAVDVRAVPAFMANGDKTLLELVLGSAL